MSSDKDSSITLILRLSCVLSILGSSIVMIACRFPETMRRKKGRQLIFWLSVSDFGTSVVYFLSTFENSDHNTPVCKSLALLGIFFPVASFFWTDFIAWHIYITIAERKIKSDDAWQVIMRIFHLIAWGCSLICITIIAVFDHAGRGGDNTGGWCWVEASEKNLIYWELIGGKFVEWTSCFIWLPFMYYLTIRTLYILEHSGSVAVANSLRRSAINSNSTGNSSSDHPDALFGRKFQIFYLKMALVPVIFFLTRLWGSLRIFLYLSNNATSERIADSYLFYLQAIFDPSQGLFNAIIFVFLSSKDRANLTIFLTTSYLIHQFTSSCHSLCCCLCFSSSDPSLLGNLETGNENGTAAAVNNRFTNRRFAVQEDTVVELSSHMPSGESEMASYDMSRDSADSSRVPTISKISRDSFSVPTTLDDEV